MEWSGGGLLAAGDEASELCKAAQAAELFEVQSGRRAASSRPHTATTSMAATLACTTLHYTALHCTADLSCALTTDYPYSLTLTSPPRRLDALPTSIDRSAVRAAKQCDSQRNRQQVRRQRWNGSVVEASVVLRRIAAPVCGARR